MRKRLLATSIITSLVVLLLMFFGGIYLSSKDNEQYAKNTAIECAVTFKEFYEQHGEIAVPEDVSYRVTMIKPSGMVIFDNDVSSVSSMENHSDRPEVVAALADAPKAEIRHSQTLGVDMVYYALKANYQGEDVIIRIAFSLASVQAYFHDSIPLLFFEFFLIAILGVAITVIFGSLSLRPLKLVKSSLEAVNRGEYTSIETLTGDAEIDGLLEEINDINRGVLKSFAKVQSEQTKLNYVLDNIADGIVAINGRNQISAINKSAQKIFGVTEITVGKPIEYLSGYSQFVSVMQNKDDQIFELELEKKTYLCFLNFLENPTKSFNRVLSIRDITERKQAENMRSEFFANASHELKTPLTVVSGFMEILSVSIKQPKQSDMIEKVLSETRRMKTLIEDMLELSNLENHAEMQAETCNISHTCSEVFETLSIESYKKNIKLTKDCDVKLKIAPNHLYELIKNLVENGVKYGKTSGSGFVHVSASQTRNHTRIVISDNGIGIDKKHQDRIFERFYRVEKSRSRATGGTGLGLSIVKHIVDLYGGTYSLASTAGRGTVISVTLPLTNS